MQASMTHRLLAPVPVQRPFCAVPAKLPRPSLAQTACAAKRSKASEFRGLSIEDIDSKVDDLKRQLFSLRIKKAKLDETWKPSDARDLKHTVAQLLTVRREIELEHGVGKRESRKLKKNNLLDQGLLPRS